MAQSFKSAFASARKAGKKEFMWNGKSYNTELKETVRPKPRATSSSKPAATVQGPMKRPSTGKQVTGDAKNTAKASPFSSQNPDFDSRMKARAALRKKK